MKYKIIMMYLALVSCTSGTKDDKFEAMYRPLFDKAIEDKKFLDYP